MSTPETGYAYIVTEETSGDSDGGPDNCIVGVYTTLDAALAEVVRREDAALAANRVVWGRNSDENGDDWDLDVHVEVWPMETSAGSTIGSKSRVVR